jgi:arylsulfatase A-like enzyme
MKPVSRRRFLEMTAGIGVGASIGLGCSSGQSTPQEENTETKTGARPNIVLIIMDTVRADKLSCYGFPHATSPALDRLAEKGVRFERVISQCSWTRPSCGSLLTSQYPRQLGIYREKEEILNDQFDTLAKILQQEGYNTFGITANPNINSVFNFHKGFDSYIDSNVIFGWMGREANQKIRGGENLPSAIEMFGQIKDWAQGQDADTPKYVQVNAMEVHEWYLRKTMIRPEYRNEFLKSGEKYPKYLQSVRQLSDDVAQFVEELSSMPGWDNTIFAIISDHGEGLDDHEGVDKGMYHGWLLYESQVVVPLILYNKTWRPKKTGVQQAVRMLELAPTLLDYAGVSIPAVMEGVSMKPLLDGAVDKIDLPEYFVCETNWRETDKTGVYVPEWKYFDNRMPQKGLPRTELQKRGGGERGVKTDASAAHPELVKQLQAYLKDWESQYPKAEPTKTSRELTEAEKEQLRAIGYIPD